MTVEIEHGWGYHIKHSAGECGLPDCDSPVDLEESKRVKISDEDRGQIEWIVRMMDERDEIVLPILSVKRVNGCFAKFDLGGYFSLWVVGESKEDVMEQLDDLYGVYEDYL